MKRQHLIVLVLTFVFVRCQISEPEKSNTEIKEIPPICDLDIYKINFTSDSANGTIISTPIAIEFFTLNKKISKFDSQYPDSLPKKLRNTDRQEIYRTIDIMGIYDAIMRPQLDSLSIKVIDSDKLSKPIVLKGKKNYNISAEMFSEQDGVLMFHPGKEPIFWDNEGSYCKLHEIVIRYYTK